MFVTIAIGVAGAKVNLKSFVNDLTLLKLKPVTNVMIVTTLMLLIALYKKVW
jgi:hypothetical protein